MEAANNKTLLNNQSVDLFSFITFLLYIISIIVSSLSIKGELQLVFTAVVTVIFFLYVVFEFGYVEKREVSFYITIPLIMSATQNIYLGIIAPVTTSSQIQTFVVLNFALSILLCLFVGSIQPSLINKHLVKTSLNCIFIISVYSFATIIIFHSSVMSGIASLRNIITPMLNFPPFWGVSNNPELSTLQLLV